MQNNKLFSQKNIAFYLIAVWVKRFQRYLYWILGNDRYSKRFDEKELPYRVKKHSSVLIRKLGVSDMKLQYNKVTNLKIAAKRINGILIKPGETFSFCKIVGLPTKRKGYLNGIELYYGEAVKGLEADSAR